MIEIMNKNQRNIAIVGAVIAVALVALLLNPRIVRAALNLVMPSPIGVPAFEEVQVGSSNAQPIKAKTEAPAIKADAPSERSAVVSAKQKRIAEIRQQITALVEELNALLEE